MKSISSLKRMLFIIYCGCNKHTKCRSGENRTPIYDFGDRYFTIKLRSRLLNCRDSNPEFQNQNLTCYRYTTVHCGRPSNVRYSGHTARRGIYKASRATPASSDATLYSYRYLRPMHHPQGSMSLFWVVTGFVHFGTYRLLHILPAQKETIR